MKLKIFNKGTDIFPYYAIIDMDIHKIKDVDDDDYTAFCSTNSLEKAELIVAKFQKKVKIGEEEIEKAADEFAEKYWGNKFIKAGFLGGVFWLRGQLKEEKK